MDSTPDRAAPSSSARDWRDAKHISAKWNAFEWSFGCALPIVCFVVERRLFLWSRDVQFFVYPFVACQIALLAFWKLSPVRSRLASLVVAGVLLVGACVAAVIGFMLLPLSTIGLLAGIGLLGFVPFGTAIAFASVCGRTYKYAAPGPWISNHAAFGFGMIVACVPPAVPMGVDAWAVDATLAQLERGDERCVEGAIARLRAIPWACADHLIDTYENSSDPALRERIDTVYRAVTGTSIEDRLVELND